MVYRVLVFFSFRVHVSQASAKTSARIVCGLATVAVPGPGVGCDFSSLTSLLL